MRKKYISLKLLVSNNVVHSKDYDQQYNFIRTWLGEKGTDRERDPLSRCCTNYRMVRCRGATAAPGEPFRTSTPPINRNSKQIMGKKQGSTHAHVRMWLLDRAVYPTRASPRQRS